MVSMKRLPEDSIPNIVADATPSEYPYGLKIYLGNAEIKKLGLEELPEPGEAFEIKCKVYVCSTHESESVEMGEDYSMTLQITDIGMKGGKKKEMDEPKVLKTMYQEGDQK